MAVPQKIAINGFGRIGRLVLRGIIETGRTDVIPELINDLGNVEDLALLLRYDSVHGRFPGEIIVNGNTITIKSKDGKRTWGPIKVTAERDPKALPLQGIDVCMECTGIFRTKEKAQPLLDAGAKHVLISAPAKQVDATIVYGVDNEVLRPDMTVISNGSCTTNCLAPICKVLLDATGIKCGYMLTVHSFTGDQRTIDSIHKDPRRGRAASVNMIPTKTGAAEAVAAVLPILKGRLTGNAVRVPTPDVSFVALDYIPERKPASLDDVNNAMKKASEAGSLKGVLGYNTDPLVSSDFIHSPFSSIFDATETRWVNDGEIVHVSGWYDNEWGFSNRMSDVAALYGEF
ncbi:type I glyceraldehyde-3-phosphate dehydrogenase [Formicincola oecophyllae]|uniref:Type I glyceraldehyde-3-phosphate dehydrogenase n=1 Tax=Formicincola oecophyllae TaxID=2558361 RepID=A0A4Y6UD83_9PROT|nr:type I glyceraldehyde-3-phosphate dehydrogenase [Formicincola oecophyllae]QDH14407.1 type I glyceraldehyde-3-phosphate dehydrogenase [Formicincola oecophyllae]